MTDVKQAARAAHARAAAREQQLAARYPQAWARLDQLRADPPGPWPDWCLLPMAAAAAVAMPAGATSADWASPPPVAELAALHAWRYSRSVWLVHPALMDRLTSQVPDHVGLDDLIGLPEWCVHVASTHPAWAGAGVWIHLESDYNTGRPELRLLVEHSDNTVTPVPVYLDRDTLTEALADFRATSVVTGATEQPGEDIRGGELDADIAGLADEVERLVALAAYLARPEADIRSLDRPGVRPVKPRRPVRDRSTWLVGYGS